MIENQSKDNGKSFSLMDIVPEIYGPYSNQAPTQIAPATSNGANGTHNGAYNHMNNLRTQNGTGELKPLATTSNGHNNTTSEPKLATEELKPGADSTNLPVPNGQSPVTSTIVSPSPANLGKVSARKKKHDQDGADYDKNNLDQRFHRLIQQLDVRPSLERPVIIGVTSTLRGEGRTTVAMGLASAISQTIPLPVALLETDLESPTLAQDFGLPTYGVSEYLRGEIELDELSSGAKLPDLAIVAAGNCDGHALDLLRSQRLTRLMEILSQHFAAIVVDLPPMCRTGEATRVISQVDKVLMVVEAGSTPNKLVKNALELVPEEKLMGVLLNRTRPAFGLARMFERLFGG